MDNLEQTKSRIGQMINAAQSILIVPSSPIDYDSVGTALTIKWWLNKLGKQTIHLFAFANIPDTMLTYPGVEQVEQKYPFKLDFSKYDLIFLLDGNAFRQFLTNRYEEVLPKIDKSKLVSIDHHQEGEIEKYIPETTLRVKDTSTGKVFYDAFIKNSGIKLELEPATWLYMSIIGDTGTFNYEIYKDTFAFAQELIDLGVDHLKAVTFNISKDSMDFTTWAIENTEYFPEIQSTVLVIDDERKAFLKEKFTDDWESKDLARYYYKVFMHIVEGYPYAIVLKSGKDDNQTKVVWRNQNYGTTIEMVKILRSIGFKANGHRNAGGGAMEINIKEAKNRFVEEMKKEFPAVIIPVSS